MTRPKQFRARDIELLQAVNAQRVTGYQSNGNVTELRVGYRNIEKKEFFRLDVGTICTRAILDYERRGLVQINRASASRYELALTKAGRSIALKYRAQPFIY